MAERVVYRYMCSNHGVEFSYYCEYCGYSLCPFCLQTGTHAKHSVKTLADFYTDQRREAERLHDKAEELIGSAKEKSENLRQLASNIEKIKQNKADKLDEFHAAVKNSLQEKCEENIQSLQTQKEKCVKFLDKATSRVQEKRKQFRSSKKAKSFQVVPELQDILSTCLHEDISSVNIDKGGIENSIKEKFPEINENPSHIYDRASLFMVIPSTTTPPPQSDTVTPPQLPSRLSPKTTEDIELEILQHSTSIDLTEHHRDLESSCVIPSTRAVIGSLLPRPQGLPAHLSGTCSTQKGEILIADSRNGCIHKLNQDLVVKHTMICRKGYQPLFLASYEGKVYTIERSLGHGCYLGTNAHFLFNRHHLRDINTPNGLAVGANTDNKVHLFVTNTLQEEGELQNKVIVLSQKGEYRGEISEQHSHIRHPFGIAYASVDNNPFLVITDMECGCLAKVELSGGHLWRDNVMARQPGVLSKPFGVAIFPQTGHIAVTEQERHQIALFTPDGHLIKRIGREGNEDGTFNKPQAIAVSPRNELIVVDSVNDKIQIIPWESLRLDD